MVKRVEDEKSIIKKYIKSGQMKDERKKNLVFTKKFFQGTREFNEESRKLLTSIQCLVLMLIYECN